MAENDNQFTLLLERVIDYGKTSGELLKLKALHKTSDIVSTLVPNSIVLFFLTLFLLFTNIGLAFWLGSLLGEDFLGFLALGGFYLIVALTLHFLLHKRIKESVSTYIIKRLLQ
jgi:hypothetical protein